MPANVYECMVILDNNKVAGDQNGAAKQLQSILERNHAEIISSRPWQERKIETPIDGHKKGLYYLTYFRSEGKNLTNIERDFRLNETILRSLILRVEAKLMDGMLEVGRSDELLFFKTVNTPPDEDLGGDDDRRERRGGGGGGGRRFGGGGGDRPPRNDGPRGGGGGDEGRPAPAEAHDKDK